MTADRPLPPMTVRQLFEGIEPVAYATIKKVYRLNDLSHMVYAKAHRLAFSTKPGSPEHETAQEAMKTARTSRRSGMMSELDSRIATVEQARDTLKALGAWSNA